MAAWQLKELVDNRADVLPLTVEQYHRMIEAGILPGDAPVELLDGYLVRKDRSKAGADPLTIGNQHVVVLSKLTILLAGIHERGRHCRIQAPVTLPPDNEPEPDFAVALGLPDRYDDAHPRAGDLTCLIEVADSSLQRDRTTKMRIYADAGIPQYVIVNLVDRVVEEYTEPLPGQGRYHRVQRLEKGRDLPLSLGRGEAVVIPVAAVLP